MAGAIGLRVGGGQMYRVGREMYGNRVTSVGKTSLGFPLSRETLSFCGNGHVVCCVSPDATTALSSPTHKVHQHCLLHHSQIRPSHRARATRAASTPIEVVQSWNMTTSTSSTHSMPSHYRSSIIRAILAQQLSILEHAPFNMILVPLLHTKSNNF